VEAQTPILAKLQAAWKQNTNALIME